MDNNEYTRGGGGGGGGGGGAGGITYDEVTSLRAFVEMK